MHSQDFLVMCSVEIKMINDNDGDNDNHKGLMSLHHQNVLLFVDDMLLIVVTGPWLGLRCCLVD